MSLDRNQIAKRIANEIQDGFVVNLGIGIPTLVANYIPDGLDVMFHSENDLLGIGPFPTDDEVDGWQILDREARLVIADVDCEIRSL